METIRSQLQNLPEKPGVYLMRDRQGRVIYVGKALSLRKRVRGYFQPGSLRRADPKLRSLVHSAERLEWHITRTEAEAVLLEGRLIKDFKPHFNILLRDDKRFPLLRLDVDEPLPRLSLVRYPRKDHALYFGPYPDGQAARAARDFAERHYGLRRCAPHEPGPEDHRHCHDDIVRFCGAPCIGKISRSAYRACATEAAAFLQGERPVVLKNLRLIMQAAAVAQDFERAAGLRDTLFLLEKALRDRARHGGLPASLRHQRTNEAGLHELAAQLALPNLPNWIEAFDISNISGDLAVASMVCARAGRPQPTRYRRFRIRTVHAVNDPAMIGEAVHRRYARLKREDRKFPDLILIDGGLTQLRAAAAALAELGLDIPLVGLAKRFEELIREREGRPFVLRLSPNSSALHILQALRDEAHRFALTYHRALRARRLRESLLDPIPGLGPKRKVALLRAFGSLSRLRNATIKEIAAQPGWGLTSAARLHAHLSALPNMTPS